MTDQQVNTALDRLKMVLDAYGVPYDGIAVCEGLYTVMLHTEMTPYKAARLRERADDAGIAVRGLTYGYEQGGSRIMFRLEVANEQR